MSALLDSLLRQNQSLLQYIAQIGGGTVDPPPFDWGRAVQRVPVPLPRPGDPAPFDYARSPGADAHAYAARAAAQPASSAQAYFGGQPQVDPPPFDWGRWAHPWYAYRRWPWIIADPVPFDVSRWHSLQDLDLVEATARLSGLAAGRVTLDDVKSVQFGDLVRSAPGGVVDPPPDDPGRFPYPFPWPFPQPRPHPWPKPEPGDSPPFDRARLEALVKLDLVEAASLLRGLDLNKLDVDTLRAIKVRDLVGELGGPKTDPVPDPYFGSMLRLHPDAIARMDKDELQATRHRLNAEMTRLKSLEGLVGQRLQAEGKQGKKA